MLKKISDKLTMVVTVLCGVVITAIVLIIIAHIILRAFNKPIKGQNEMVQYLTMTMAVLMLSRTCLEDKHIYVSVFTDHIPHTLRMIIYAVGRFIGAAAVAAMSVKFIQNLPQNAARKSEVLRVPFTLLHSIMAIGLAVAALMFVVQGILYLMSIKNSKQDPSGETINGFRDDMM